MMLELDVGIRMRWLRLSSYREYRARRNKLQVLSWIPADSCAFPDTFSTLICILLRFPALFPSHFLLCSMSSRINQTGSQWLSGHFQYCDRFLSLEPKQELWTPPRSGRTCPLCMSHLPASISYKDRWNSSQSLIVLSWHSVIYTLGLNFPFALIFPCCTPGASWGFCGHCSWKPRSGDKWGRSDVLHPIPSRFPSPSLSRHACWDSSQWSRREAGRAEA